MLRERCQARKIAEYVILSLWSGQNRQIQRDREQIGGGGRLLIRTELPSGRRERSEVRMGTGGTAPRFR